MAQEQAAPGSLQAEFDAACWLHIEALGMRPFTSEDRKRVVTLTARLADKPWRGLYPDKPYHGK